MIRDSRVLVTGGAGFIGSHLVDQLQRREPREIIVFDNFTRGTASNLEPALARSPLTVREGDIRDRQALADVMKGVDVVFHQAGIRITQSAEDPRFAMEILSDGTFNVLEAAVASGVRKVVAASSASVYGLADEFPTTETHHPYNNRTLYGAAKAFNELLLRSFHEMYGLNYVALRYFNVYGPRMDVAGAYTEVFVRWMERIAAGSPPVIFGDGTQTMDFVYVEDIARANVMAAEADVTDEVFNVASGIETSLTELATTISKAMNATLQPEYGPVRKVNPVPRRLADTQKARQMLGFDVEVPLAEGVGRLVEWWRNRAGA